MQIQRIEYDVVEEPKNGKVLRINNKPKERPEQNKRWTEPRKAITMNHQPKELEAVISSTTIRNEILHRKEED